MKKLLALIVMLALGSQLFAQKTYVSKQGYEIPANEASFSYGYVTYPTVIYTFAGALATAFTGGLARMSTAYSIGSFGLEYHRWVHRNVAVGGLFTYEDYILGFDSRNGSDADGNAIYKKGPSQSHHVISIMPSVKFSWFAKEKVSMYSKISVGAMFLYSPETSVTSTDDDGSTQTDVSEGESSVGVAFQVNPVGIDFGGQSFRGFVELGFGCQGLIMAGVRYRF